MRGSYGTKMEAVVRRLLAILSSDDTAKVCSWLLLMNAPTSCFQQCSLRPTAMFCPPPPVLFEPLKPFEFEHMICAACSWICCCSLQMQCAMAP